MDHQPFEDWLLHTETLAADEQRQLNAHLQVCPSCRALAEVTLALKSIKMAEPAAGFVDRFQLRLTAQKKALRRRNFWGFLLLTMSVLCVLTFLAWPIITGLLHSPVDLLTSWFGALLSLWVALDAMAHASLALFKVIPGFVPTYIWTVVLFAACGWSLIWVYSLIRFSKFVKGVQQ